MTDDEDLKAAAAYESWCATLRESGVRHPVGWNRSGFIAGWAFRRASQPGPDAGLHMVLRNQVAMMDALCRVIGGCPEAFMLGEAKRATEAWLTGGEAPAGEAIKEGRT